jgi:hypothetical protein
VASRPEEPRLESREHEFATISRTACIARQPRCPRDRVGREQRRLDGEEDPFARNRVDEPAASPIVSQPSPESSMRAKSVAE